MAGGPPDHDRNRCPRWPSSRVSSRTILPRPIRFWRTGPWPLYDLRKQDRQLHKGRCLRHDRALARSDSSFPLLGKMSWAWPSLS